MRFYFRPILYFTALMAPLFAILIGLGVWQIERLHWKLGLIAEVNRNLTAPPIGLDKALAMGAGAQYRHVALEGHFENAREVYVFATGPDGAAVYHVLTPFVTTDGRMMMVDRGIVPPERRNSDTRRKGQLEGIRRIVGVWRKADPPGLFIPPADLGDHVWYARDLKLIAITERLSLASLYLVEIDATPVPGGWPKGGQTVVTFRNEHLQYAMTWFGLAAALLFIYFAYHRSRGRLG